MPSPLRAVLIGGTSHTGKSTLAAALATRLGGEARSTDRLARHPGRPWATPPHAPPPHVAEHYGTLGADDLMASVLAHYRRLAPQIAELVVAAAPERPLVLEGSALMPETIAPLVGEDVVGVMLSAPDALLIERVHAESGYAQRDDAERRLIDVFLARASAFNRLVAEQAAEAGLAIIGLGDRPTTDALAVHIAALCRSRREQSN
jgi:2-phosphoglycerate kinase